MIDLKTLKRESDKFGETNDCAVRAVAAVTNTPYDLTWKAFMHLGRKSRKGTPFHITLRVLKSLGVLAELKPKPAKTVRTLKRVLPKKGRFLVRTAGHILPCVNGEVIDWTDGRLNRVKEFWEISF